MWETKQTWPIKGFDITENGIVILLGRVVKTEEGEAKAKEFDILFTEVSAKAGHNVANLFKTLAVHLAGNEATPNTNQPGPGQEQPASSKISLQT